MSGYLLLGALLGLEIHRLARVTPLDLAAFQVFTGRLAGVERLLSGRPLPDPAAGTADLSVAEARELARREFLVRAVQMIRSEVPAATPRAEAMRRLRILAPRKGVRALELGALADATDWLQLAVAIGGARREVILLRRLCMALREGEADEADYYRAYLLHVLGESRLRAAVAVLDVRK
jgi:hypothetical protein